MKKLISLALVLLLLAACFSGCAKDAASGELVVFAAASMTETLTELGAAFEKENPGLKITFNFESSGKLMDQIIAGGDRKSVV